MAICPCEIIEPCKNTCTCSNPVMSGGCDRCCTYGSKAQRIARAEVLAFIIDGFIALGKATK